MDDVSIERPRDVSSPISLSSMPSQWMGSTRMPRVLTDLAGVAALLSTMTTPTQSQQPLLLHLAQPVSSLSTSAEPLPFSLSMLQSPAPSRSPSMSSRDTSLGVVDVRDCVSLRLTSGNSVVSRRGSVMMIGGCQRARTLNIDVAVMMC